MQSRGVNAMKNESPNFGTSRGSHCLLKGLDGVTYQALLGELSLTGASIKFLDNVPHGLQVGEMCGLMLSDNPKLSSTKFTGRIIELKPGGVGISFNHQEHQHKKHKYSPPQA